MRFWYLGQEKKTCVVHVTRPTLNFCLLPYFFSPNSEVGTQTLGVSWKNKAPQPSSPINFYILAFMIFCMLEVIHVLEKMTYNIWKTFEKKCILLTIIVSVVGREQRNKRILFCYSLQTSEFEEKDHLKRKSKFLCIGSKRIKTRLNLQK